MMLDTGCSTLDFLKDIFHPESSNQYLFILCKNVSEDILKFIKIIYSFNNL